MRHAPRWWIGGVLAAAGVAAIAAAIYLSRTPPPPAHPAPPPRELTTTTPGPAPLPAPAPDSGKLQIQTIPAGAAIKLDGNDVGSTPIEITVKAGAHRLHVELAGYAVIDADQDIHAAERTSAVITLQPAKATSTPTTGSKVKSSPKIVTTTHPIGSGTSAVPLPDPYGEGSDDIAPTPTKKAAPTPPPPGGAKSMPNPY
jgi:hypothetical protein